jgi:CBS domain containing-hemolysin-like protein
MELLLSFFIIALLILLNGLFVAAEFGIIGVRPSRVEQLAQEGNRTAIGIRQIIRTPGKQDRYIATAQLGITLASLGLGMYGEPVIAHLIELPLHDWFGLEGAIVHTISFIIALTIMTYLHVVLGEMVPKSIALQNAAGTVLMLATPMAIMQRIFSLGITLLNGIGLIVLKLLRVPPPEKGSRLHTPSELELIVSESFEGGLLDPGEQQLISNIFDFSDRRVGQVMTPRTRIEAVPITISQEELLKKFIDLPYSRLPIYKDSLDNIIGVIHLKYFVRHQLTEDEPFDLLTMKRDVHVVPESLHVERLLTTLKKRHQHIAIVIDEYGGTAGLVTLEDVIEEVVGEVRDEFDMNEQEAVKVIEPGYLIAQGEALLDEIKEYVDVGTHHYDVETIGGLVLAELNRPPKEGDKRVLNNATFHVEAVEGLAIKRLAIRYQPSP